MYKTGSQKRKALRSYRRRVKRSTCRRKTNKRCRSSHGCKIARGRKRTFCRRAANVSRRR
jgi:hypothetical protein